MKAKDVKNLFNNEDDWGTEMKLQTMVKAGKLVVVDSFYFHCEEAMERLVDAWTTGHMAKFMKEEHGVSFKVVDSFVQMTAQGRWKKFTDNGVVGVELELV
jgi:cytochrome oxidase Cu insertion factor (SCO1/SenC/PrrC family)